MLLLRHPSSTYSFYSNHRLILSPALPSPGFYTIAYTLWQVLILIPFFSLIPPESSGDRSESWEWALFVLALVLLSPVPSSYHLVVLVLCITLLIDHLLPLLDWRATLLIVAAYTAYLYCGPCSTAVSYSNVYLLSCSVLPAYGVFLASMDLPLRVSAGVSLGTRWRGSDRMRPRWSP